MKKSKERLKVLLKSYFDQSIMPEELSEFSDYVLDEDYQSDLEQMFPNAFEGNVLFTGDGLEQNLKQNILTYIFNYRSVEIKKPKQRRLWFYMTSAAAVLVLLASVIWFYTLRPSKTNSYSYVNNIAPGRNTATLKLANGKVIHLSEAKAGLIISNTKNGSVTGQLSYNDGSSIEAELTSLKGQLNEASTPKGGQYQITLPDGTMVWLNANSTLKFPSSFTKSKQRKVELTGEAYFEVAKVMIKEKGTKPTKMPFIVLSKDQEVEVLGTHFNINSYPDESSIKTTLLEGSVQVSVANAKNTPYKLTPGMQSILSSKGIKLQQLENPEAAISWKSGYFTFNREHLDEIMRKVSRWYDVNIIYDDESIKTIPFSGTITRFAQVSELLKMLELTDKVTFKIEDKTIIVNRK
jgi:transmembrane sensor